MRAICGLLLLCLSLCACNDGGGSSGAANVFNLRAADAQFQSNSRTYNATYVYSGAIVGIAPTGAGTIIFQAPTAEVFQGTAALRKSFEAVTVQVIGGVAQPNGPVLSIAYDEHYSNEYALLGAAPAASTDYIAMQTNAGFPSAVHPGDSGTAWSFKTFTDSTQATLVSTVTRTYSVSADTSASVSIRVVTTTTSVSGPSAGTTNVETRTFRLDALGNLTLTSLSNASPGDAIQYSVQ